MPISLSVLPLVRAGVLLVTALVLGGCSAVGTLNALSPRDTFTLRTGIVYGNAPREQLDVYIPHAAAPAGGWPMVVFFYGGSWTHGARGDYRFLGAALAQRGILTLVADYRLYPAVHYPDFLNDSARAVAYGLEHAAELGADPTRVFAMGHSAGAYNAAMLALDPRWLDETGHTPAELAGWIGLAGPYDFLPSDDPEIRSVFDGPNDPSQAQPIDFVQPNAPRSFLAAGRIDRVVDPKRSTQQLAAKLAAQGDAVTLKIYPHTGHAPLVGAIAGPLHWVAPVLDDVVAFVGAGTQLVAAP